MALLEPGEAADAYKARILKYQEGADPLALQAAAPEKLAKAAADLNGELGDPRDAAKPVKKAKTAKKTKLARMAKTTTKAQPAKKATAKKKATR